MIDGVDKQRNNDRMELINDTEIMSDGVDKRYRNNDRKDLINDTEIMIGIGEIMIGWS